MEERIDYTVKWYLRIVAGTYILMFIPLVLQAVIYGYTSYIAEELYEWYLMMPFFDGSLDLGTNSTGWITINFEYSFVPYIFWSFWLGTLIRWNITGKHFYQ